MTTPPEQDDTAPVPDNVDARFSKIEAEQDRQGGVLDQILARLPGAGSGQSSGGGSRNTTEDEGRSIAELVREGVERIEADKKRQQQEAATETERQELAERVARLEERPPSEASRIKRLVWKWGFGLDDTGH